MHVLTFIRRSPSAAFDCHQLIGKLTGLDPTIAFSQTYPDEVQGAFVSAEAAVRGVLLAARGQAFWTGVGVGSLKAPRFAAALGAVSTVECAGDSLGYSRLAVEQASTGSPPRGVAVVGADRVFSEQATGLMRLLYRVAADRSATENKVIDLLVPGVRGQQKAVAQALGISTQAVSKTLVRALYHEQEAAIPALIEALLRLDT